MERHFLFIFCLLGLSTTFFVGRSTHHIFAEDSDWIRGDVAGSSTKDDEEIKSELMNLLQEAKNESVDAQKSGNNAGKEISSDKEESTGSSRPEIPSDSQASRGGVVRLQDSDDTVRAEQNGQGSSRRTESLLDFIGPSGKKIITSEGGISDVSTSPKIEFSESYTDLIGPTGRKVGEVGSSRAQQSDSPPTQRESLVGILGPSGRPIGIGQQLSDSPHVFEEVLAGYTTQLGEEEVVFSSKSGKVVAGTIEIILPGGLELTSPDKENFSVEDFVIIPSHKGQNENLAHAGPVAGFYFGIPGRVVRFSDPVLVTISLKDTTLAGRQVLSKRRSPDASFHEFGIATDSPPGCFPNGDVEERSPLVLLSGGQLQFFLCETGEIRIGPITVASDDVTLLFSGSMTTSLSLSSKEIDLNVVTPALLLLSLDISLLNGHDTKSLGAGEHQTSSLGIWLRSPQGKQITVVSPGTFVESAADRVFLQFSESASKHLSGSPRSGLFRPAEPFSVFSGEDINGDREIIVSYYGWQDAVLMHKATLEATAEPVSDVFTGVDGTVIFTLNQTLYLESSKGIQLLEGEKKIGTEDEEGQVNKNIVTTSFGSRHQDMQLERPINPMVQKMNGSRRSMSVLQRGTRVKSMRKRSISFQSLTLENIASTPASFTLPIIGGVTLGPDDDHLIFTKPVQLDIAVDGAFEGEEVFVYVYHYGESKFGTKGLTTNPDAVCDSEGKVHSDDRNHRVQVVNGYATIWTCGASTFTVTYVGGATFANFVDNGTLDKTISITTGDVGIGALIQDMQVIVDFQPIDSEDPTNFGATNAYSDEVSMLLTHPNGTTSVNLLVVDTYTNQAFSPRVTVTFDDAASSLPSGLPATGTFLPNQSLSAFDGLSPLGDRTFTLGDDTNQDGVILYGVTLQITDNAICGDGILLGGEGCDDGGTTPGDGCSSTCLIESASACNFSGQGVEGSGSCESGVCDENETIPTCESADVCGNGLIESGEQCDDGGTTNGDGCNAICQIEFCGNGTIDAAPVTGSVLFLEDFESMGNGTVTTNGVIHSETGYTLSFETSGANGRVRYGTTAVQNNGGAGAATLDVSVNNTLRTNYLIFEVDLSDAVGVEDLELSFDFSQHGEESQANDRVWIRGSSSDSFVLAYDRDANSPANGTYASVVGIDIDALLAANSQEVSSTFQIRFGQEDNFPASSTTANDGLSIDNVQINGTIPGPSVDETCDDGDTSGGDGCDASCQIESGYTCLGEPSVCTLCGDGVIAGGEACDDGDTANGDGCDASCLVETGRNCSGTPSVCTSTCGDGIPVGTEECDDGDTANGDGCDASCQVESGYSCSGIPSACTTGCGNGTVAGSEQCDDGNTSNGDGCSDICRVEFCGNDQIDLGVEVGAVLFSEDFEFIGNGTLTANGTIYSDTGYVLSFQTSGTNGRVRYGTTAVQDNGGVGALTLDVSVNNTLRTNYLIFQIDLSDTVGSTDLALAFDFSQHGEESQTNDRVRIRGNSSAGRIQAYDWYANRGANGTYVSVSGIDVDALLAADNQIPSSTFQIRFGQEDNFPATSTTANDGLSIDNVQITGTRQGPSVDEQCDDGNTNNGDGCDSSCNTEPDFVCDQENIILSYLVSGIDETTDTVSFASFTTKEYTEIPIILATPQSQNNGDNYPIPVISNVTTGGFDIRLCLDDGLAITCAGAPNSEDFAVFVVDRTADACTDHIEAGQTVITTNGNDTAFSFTGTFTNVPYVFTTPQTANQGLNIAAHAWVDDGSLTVNGGDFVGCVHQAPGGAQNEDTCTTGQPNETLGRVAIDPILFSMTGFDIGTQSIGNSTWTTITFSPVYADIPGVMVTQNSDNGAQDPQYPWARNVGTGSAEIRYCEADANGVCHTHTNEDVMRFSLPYATLPPGTGEVCLFGPSSFSFSGMFQSESYVQILEQQIDDYFIIQDFKGADSGYYTTLEISSFTGVGSGDTISNAALERYASGVDLLSGVSNSAVVLASGRASYRVATGSFVFLKRDPGINGGKTGEYGARLWLHFSLPPYLRPDLYTATLTYTLYEN